MVKGQVFQVSVLQQPKHTNFNYFQLKSQSWTSSPICLGMSETSFLPDKLALRKNK